ncbi:MAG: zeta toxin family protein [Alistipes indistinctus]
MIPEYRAMLASKDPLLVKEAAKFVHEESSIIGKGIQGRAMNKGLASIFDGINNDSADKIAGKVAKLRQQSGGKRIRADYVSLDTELSLKLAEARAKKTGRNVPEDVIVKSNRGVAAMMPEVIGRRLFDELYLWDTNVNETPLDTETDRRGADNRKQRIV